MRKLLLLALTLAGLFDALYLLWVYSSPSHPLVCTGIGCDVVRASRYAHLWGQPLPVYGVVMYAALLVAILAQAWLNSAGARRVAQVATALISGGGFAFSVYLTALEAFVIHAYCAWCLGSAAIITLIFALALADLRATDFPGDQTTRSALRGQFAAVLVVMAVAGVIAFRYLSNRPELPPLPQVSAATLDEHLVRPDSHAIGSPDAPVTVVEFGDFECPMCGNAQPMIQQMLDKYGSQIRFVFRQFPVNEIHPYAQTAAEASECAAEQGKFWETERKFYQEQADLTEPALDRYAAEIGLNVKALDQCLVDGSVRARVQQDVDDGKAVGVQGTPTFFVGHQRLFGLTQYKQLSQLIDAQLAGEAPGLQASVESSSAPAAGNGSGSGDASGGGLGGFGSSDGSNPFASSPSSELACTADEAKKQQPALIHTPEVQQLFQSALKPVFIDVRPTSQFAGGHLPGALSIPVDEIEPRAASLPKDRTLILYESGKAGANPADVCAVSRAGARVLLASGFSYDRVKVYQDGLAGWEKAGLPVEK
jgi:protein-disulfide isomerase/uncharacterized membrane protein/rhodanese-related sulfurtransferase